MPLLYIMHRNVCIVPTFCGQTNGVECCSQCDGVDLCSQSDDVPLCFQSDGVNFQSQFSGVEFCPGVVAADFCSEAPVSDVELSRILVTVLVRVLSRACAALSAPDICVQILSLVQHCVYCVLKACPWREPDHPCWHVRQMEPDALACHLASQYVHPAPAVCVHRAPAVCVHRI